MTRRRRDSRIVFDASPLASFAVVGRLDLLESRYADGALWTVEVRDEIERGVPSNGELRDVLTAAWLGQPIRLDSLDVLLRIERLRFRLGGNGRSVRRHRGEAATIVAAQVHDAACAIDDLDARRLAQALDVPVVGTLGILQACCRDGGISWDDGWEVYQAMRAVGRHLPELSRAQFERV